MTEALSAAVSVAIVVALILLVDSSSCVVKTRDLRLPHRWTPTGSCQVEVQPGNWISFEEYRRGR